MCYQLASTVLPSGELTKTWQVINSELDFRFIVVLVTTVSPSSLTATEVEFSGGKAAVAEFSKTGVVFT